MVSRAVVPYSYMENLPRWPWGVDLTIDLIYDIVVPKRVWLNATCQSIYLRMEIEAVPSSKLPHQLHWFCSYTVFRVTAKGKEMQIMWLRLGIVLITYPDCSPSRFCWRESGPCQLKSDEQEWWHWPRRRHMSMYKTFVQENELSMRLSPLDAKRVFVHLRKEINACH